MVRPNQVQLRNKEGNLMLASSPPHFSFFLSKIHHFVFRAQIWETWFSVLTYAFSKWLRPDYILACSPACRALCLILVTVHTVRYMFHISSNMVYLGRWGGGAFIIFFPLMTWSLSYTTYFSSRHHVHRFKFSLFLWSLVCGLRSTPTSSTRMHSHPTKDTPP